MRSQITACFLMAASASVAHAEAIDFANPGVAMTAQAVIASGTCIAKYTSAFEDVHRTASEIGQRVAAQCAREISKSVGLATWMVGKPEEFSKNLKYTQEELTTGAVLRLRAAAAHRHSA